MLFRKKDWNFYYNGFTGDRELFSDFLKVLKVRHSLVSVSVFYDYGSHGLEIAETTISDVESFSELNQNMLFMYTNFLDFLDKDRKSIFSTYGKNARFRKGVKDIQLYRFTFKNRLFDCYIVCEGAEVFRKNVLPLDSLKLAKAFIYQKQLVDFLKVGYAYDGYLGLPSRDALLERLRTVDDLDKTTYVIGIRVINMVDLEEKHYRRCDVMEELIHYFSSYYKGDMFSLGNERIAIVYKAFEALECVDVMEAHLSSFSQRFPWISLTINVTPVSNEPFRVVCELEQSLLECNMESITVSRQCRKIAASYENSEEYRVYMECERENTTEAKEIVVQEQEEDMYEEISDNGTIEWSVCHE